MEQENKQIELRSEKVRNIIGKVPPFLLRNGMAMIGLAFAVMIGVATFLTFRPSINTTIDAKLRNSNEVFFSSKIPQDVLKKIDDYTAVISKNTLPAPFPNHFQIKSISDTIYFSGNQAWYTATLQPTDTLFQNLKLTEDIVIPAKIEFKKQSILEWIFQLFKMKK